MDSLSDEKLRFIISFSLYVLLIGNFGCKSTSSQLPPDPSVKKEVEVGRILAARLVKQYGLVKDEEFTLYILSVGRSLANVSSRQELNFVFGILDTDEVNAFACPGGYIFLTKGSLKWIENEAELAFVLSHELSHVVLKHSGEFESGDSGLFHTLASLMTPGGNLVSSFTKAAIDTMYQEFFETGREKKLELEADRAASVYMSLLGYNTKASFDYLTRIKRADKNETLLKTHPVIQERVENLERFLREQRFPTGGRFEKESYQNQYRKFLSRSKVSFLQRIRKVS